MHSFLYQKISKFFFEQYWNIGFVEFTSTLPIQENMNIEWLKHHYKKGWFADPFILNISDNYYEVLVEEYCYAINRGRIDRLVIDRNTKELKEMHVILELDTHLSFPAIFRENEEIYVYPENSESGVLTIYKYDGLQKKLINPVVIVDEAIVDAVCVKLASDYYIFATKYGTRDDDRRLLIYQSDCLLTPFHRISELVLCDETARGAGDFICLGDTFIRPSQDCQNNYGGGVVFSQIDYIAEDGIFNCTELGRIYPNSKRYNVGLHTYNQYENIAVVDGYGYRKHCLGNWAAKIKNILKNG